MFSLLDITSKFPSIAISVITKLEQYLYITSRYVSDLLYTKFTCLTPLVCLSLLSNWKVKNNFHTATTLKLKKKTLTDACLLMLYYQTILLNNNSGSHKHLTILCTHHFVITNSRKLKTTRVGQLPLQVCKN
jgi:hypothetical protein